MTTLTAPPPPPPVRMDLPVVSFFGRSLEEYTRFFALEPAKLRRRVVLDVAAGPASFAAEAVRHGIDAVAVDPLYDRSAHALTEQVRHDYEKMLLQMRAKAALFRGRSFPSLAAAASDRRAAAQRFLTDYEGNARHGRYVRGALPRLPFLDGAFDLVLCAHLLFLYSAQFDFDWHLAACVELARVSGGEVRIHPVCGTDGRPYAQLPRLRRELRARGIGSEVVPVDYEFFAGSSSMLVLQRE
ncbi:MAG TPA: class I SAM-dependent methyltransferase [Lacunisphaera sp.]|jgi:SAM-dependent methyltransferase|nr:class I SAM-dependent methyltransferase [Lacunisphaera sp.]